MVPWEGGMMAAVLTVLTTHVFTWESLDHLFWTPFLSGGQFLTSQLDLLPEPANDNLKPTID